MRLSWTGLQSLSDELKCNLIRLTNLSWSCCHSEVEFGEKSGFKDSKDCLNPHLKKVP